MEEDRRAFKTLKDKPTGKKHLGRPRRRWEDNIIIVRIIYFHYLFFHRRPTH